MFHIPANIKILIVQVKNQILRIGGAPASFHFKSSLVYAQIERLVFAVFLAIGTCNATIIFVSLSRDAIYIGADGRLTASDDSGQERDGGPTCKIQQFGSIFVADSGMVRDDSTGFDVWKFFDSIKANSVSDFADKVAQELPEKYQTVYTARKERIGKTTQNSPGDIGVFGFVNGKPEFFWIYFSVNDGIIKATIHDEGKEFARGGASRLTIPIGKTDAPVPDDLHCTDEDEVTSIRCYLAAYIKAEPRYINEPIAILKITSMQHEWIEPGACGDGKQQPSPKPQK
jgi:hypothetical protein